MTPRSVRITGWGMYAPERVMTNDDLSKLVDTSDEWIVSRTGIRERRGRRVDEPCAGQRRRTARCVHRDGLVGHVTHRRKTSVALCPPNPKLLLIATLTGSSRASFGT